MLDLIHVVDMEVERLVPLLKLGKELTYEFNDRPSTINKTRMLLARQKVYEYIVAMEGRLVDRYRKCGSRTKKLMNITDFREFVRLVLTNNLEEGNTNG